MAITHMCTWTHTHTHTHTQYMHTHQLLRHIGDTVLEGKKVTCMKPMHKQVIEFRWLKTKRGGFDFISKLKHIGDTVLEGKKVTCMK